jgi:hypothetical protein
MPPISRASFGVCQSNDVEAGLFVAEDDLKGKFYHTASAMAAIDFYETIWIANNGSNCAIHSQKKVSRGGGASYRIPVR